MSVLLIAIAGISIVCTFRIRSPSRWLAEDQTAGSRWYPGRLAAMNWHSPSSCSVSRHSPCRICMSASAPVM